MGPFDNKFVIGPVDGLAPNRQGGICMNSDTASHQYLKSQTLN